MNCTELQCKFNKHLTHPLFFNSMWESNREPDTNDKSWNDLTAAERTAAGVLGYNTKKVSAVRIVHLKTIEYCF